MDGPTRYLLHGFTSGQTKVPTGNYYHEADYAALLSELTLARRVVEAATEMAREYKELADCGDCGNWSAGDVEEYRNLDAALSAYRKEVGG